MRRVRQDGEVAVPGCDIRRFLQLGPVQDPRAQAPAEEVGHHGVGLEEGLGGHLQLEPRDLLEDVGRAGHELRLAACRGLAHAAGARPEQAVARHCLRKPVQVFYESVLFRWPFLQ